MEEKMNTVQRDPLVLRRDSGVRQLENALTELQEIINNAQTVWTTGKCMVDRKAASELLTQIHRLLPDAVKQASQITKDEQSIRDKATREASEQTKKARDDAQKLLDDAEKEAQDKVAAAQKKAEEISRNNMNAANAASTMKAQAEQEAAGIRQNAQNAANALYMNAKQEIEMQRRRAEQEAQMIIADAQARANELKSKETVYQMAVMAANDLREQTEKDMAAMRQYYITECCNMMAEVDDYLMRLVANVRAERQRLFNSQ